MAPKVPRLHLEVSIAGSGITPLDVPIDQLAELLEATAELLSAVEAEIGSDRVLPSLHRVKKGSAKYVFVSKAEEWEPTLERTLSVIESRGANATPKVRSGLHRLYRSGRVGRIKVGGSDRQGARRKPLLMAEPVPEPPPAISHSNEVHGRAVGVNAYETGWSVRLQLADGGRRDYSAEEGTAEAAARLFNRQVRATVRAKWSPSHGDHADALDEVEAWQDADLVEAMEKAREEVAKTGVKVDVDKLLSDFDD
jgi:hypothetical protein